jgi:hypothetical protein
LIGAIRAILAPLAASWCPGPKKQGPKKPEEKETPPEP